MRKKIKNLIRRIQASSRQAAKDEKLHANAGLYKLAIQARERAKNYKSVVNGLKEIL